MSAIDRMESGFRINNLLLLESKFNRINNVKFREGGLDLDTNIETEVSVQDKIISVSERVVVTQKEGETEQFSFIVKMVGVFECIGDTQLNDYEEFGRVNGAAIIFPYIREHITSLSLKAGLMPIILAPVNFTNSKKK